MKRRIGSIHHCCCCSRVYRSCCCCCGSCGSRGRCRIVHFGSVRLKRCRRPTRSLSSGSSFLGSQSGLLLSMGIFIRHLRRAGVPDWHMWGWWLLWRWRDSTGRRRKLKGTGLEAWSLRLRRLPHDLELLTIASRAEVVLREWLIRKFLNTAIAMVLVGVRSKRRTCESRRDNSWRAEVSFIRISREPKGLPRIECWRLRSCERCRRQLVPSSSPCAASRCVASTKASLSSFLRMSSSVPSRERANADRLQGVVIGHLVLVDTPLLSEVTFTSADPVRAIHLLPWSDSGIFAISMRNLTTRCLFDLVAVLCAGSNKGVNLGLSMSDVTT